MHPSVPVSRRTPAIVVSVLLLHGLALWAMQSGLLQRAVEWVVPVEVLSEVVDLPPAPPPPKTERPPENKPTEPAKPTAIRPTEPTAPQPMPVAVADASPGANAPTGVSTPQAAPAPMGTPVAAPVAVAAPAAANVELPSSNADYLNNRSAKFPRLSRDRGEHGRVVLRVLIGADGSAQQADIHQSSGFDRLDQAGLSTVLRWRYVPGKRGGVPEAMWFNVPIDFILEQ